MSGVIAQREAATGPNVARDTILFRVVDAAQVHVVGQVPEGTRTGKQHGVREQVRLGNCVETVADHGPCDAVCP